MRRGRKPIRRAVAPPFFNCGAEEETPGAQTGQGDRNASHRLAAVELERAPGPFTGQEGSTATLLQLRLRRGRAPETFTDRRGL